MRQELLPPELVWGEGGHVSDVVLTTIGDGEAGVPPDARAHVDGCVKCKAALGNVALLSLYAHENIVAARDLGMLDARAKDAAAATATASFRFPFGAVVFAFALALVTCIPGILEAPDDARSAGEFVQRNLHVLMHHFTTSLRVSEGAASQGALVLTVTSTLFLTFLALLVARRKAAHHPESP